MTACSIPYLGRVLRPGLRGGSKDRPAVNRISIVPPAPPAPPGPPALPVRGGPAADAWQQIDLAVDAERQKFGIVVNLAVDGDADRLELRRDCREAIDQAAQQLADARRVN